MSQPISKAQMKSFKREGYLVIPGVLTKDEVRWLRDFFRPKFYSDYAGRIPVDTEQTLWNIYNRFPETQWLLFHKRTNQILTQLLGENFGILPEQDVHLNVFGGWHRDTDRQEKAGKLFHRSRDYLIVNTAFYLQDNTKEYGGGLVVIPGSHRKRRTFEPKEKVSIWERLRGNRPMHSIPAKSGDLIIFDIRVNHRASHPTQPITDPDSEKIVIFGTYSRNNAHLKAHDDFIHSRSDYAYLKHFHYSPQIREQLERHGISLP